MPTNVGILTFISRINDWLLWFKPEITIDFGYFSIYEQLKFHAQLSWERNKFYNLGAWYSLERGASNVYQQSMVWAKVRNISSFFHFSSKILICTAFKIHAVLEISTLATKRPSSPSFSALPTMSPAKRKLTKIQPTNNTDTSLMVFRCFAYNSL